MNNPNLSPSNDSEEARAALWREQQWQTSQDLHDVTIALRQQILTDPRPPLRLIHQTLQLSSIGLKLGRQALESAYQAQLKSGIQPIPPELQAALDKVYGPSNPATDHLAPHLWHPMFQKQNPAATAPQPGEAPPAAPPSNSQPSTPNSQPPSG